METRQDYLKIRDLVDLRRNDLMRVNPEYQRGEVWTRPQQMKLIDSVLRGYQLPVIYLHKIRKVTAGFTQDRLEIIDGQQRIQSLYLFAEGAFQLFDPADVRARFPRFLQDQPCPWAGRNFDSLNEDLKDQFLECQLPISYIESEDENEIRDLFVRLQAGSSLNAQEKRDAYPGDFTEFILKLGGKPEIPRFPGHDFFRRVLRLNPSKGRGKTRQLAAQIAILFLSRRGNGNNYYSDINAKAIDDYYYTNVDFDSNTPDCQRLIDILDKLDLLLGDGKRPALKGHDAIHLVLFLDTIWDDYVPSWEGMLAGAQDRFSAALAKSIKNQKERIPDEFWNLYGIWTRSNSDRGENIQRRHHFYSQRMFEYLGNLTPKDPNRAFGPLEREIVFWRDQGKCKVCNGAVLWDSAEIHHVKEHSQGGQTILDNAVLVHDSCHPKGDAAKKFAESYNPEAG